MELFRLRAVSKVFQQSAMPGGRPGITFLLAVKVGIMTAISGLLRDCGQTNL